MPEPALSPTMTFLPVCDSTQQYARRMLERGGVAGCQLVVTDHQTRGHGRDGRRWLDVPGSALLASIAFQGPFTTDVLDELSLRAAGAVRDVLARHVMDARRPIDVASPNDLMVDGRKLGGVLVDCQTRGDHVEWLIVGVGVNLRGSRFSVDGTDATTCEAEWAAQISRDELAHDVADALLRRCVAPFSAVASS